jgi:uncharacterized protein (DUF2461 family)
MLNGDEFQKTVDMASGFILDSGDALKRIPAGFPADSAYAEYFKLKDYFLMKFVDDAFILSDNLLENVVEEYKKTFAFNTLLNKVVDYAHEDNL